MHNSHSVELSIERAHQLNVLDSNTSPQLAVWDGPVLLDPTQLLYLCVKPLAEWGREEEGRWHAVSEGLREWSTLISP